ncbi:PAS domain S-box protein [uncultured Methanoregula sp.]|uniref:PAS domain S-box protein n=1 Tax=uncultured Methanoregula sp. TaxID=1005933 RepID=UPI002AAB9135|nr:PAS domain S-box protein [uncultured Methanoregula sp.]
MYSILYVDDEESLLEIGKLFLEKDGTMAVEILTSAKEALDRIASAPFDAIISDYQMPGMDGIGFLKAVRSGFPDLPFILFTGRGREEVVIQAINNGADFYIQKGGDPRSQFAELAHKVRMAVERRRAEQALQRETSFTQAIFDSVPGILYLYDSDGKLIRWNRNLETITGYSGAELGSRHGLDWFPDPADKQTIRHALDIAKREGQASVEAHLATRSGTRVPFFLTLRRLDIGNRVYYTGIGVDITERHRAEKALHASEEKFRGISERSSDLIYVEDEQGMITYASPSITRILGYTQEEVTGVAGDMFVMDEDQKKVRSGRDVKRQGGSLENFEIRVKRKDGSIAVLDLQAIPVMKDGIFSGLQMIGRDVTGRKKAEKALQESEERYRILSEHSQDGVFMEQDGAVVFCNRAFATITGYAPEELPGKPIIEFIAPEDLPRIMDQYARSMAGEPIPEHMEFALVHADGKTRIYITMSVGMGTCRDRPASTGTIRDVTRDRSQVQALKESEELYHTLSDSLPDYVIVHRGGTILYANRLAAGITGISQEDLAGHSIFEFIAPESRDLVLKKIQQRVEGKTTGWYEVAVQPREGRTSTALVHTTEIPYRGSPAILIVMSDITAHKQMEATLRESEERFRILTEHSQDTIMLFDRELRHLYVNPVVVKGLGIPHTEFIGKTHREMGFPEHLVRLWEDSIRKVLDSNVPVEVEFQIPGGIWVDWQLVPVHGPDGSVDQVLASARVITKLKLVEETLRRASRQVNLLNAITRHDILNQITVILAYLSLAEKKSPGAEMEGFLRKLKSAAETIRDQIEFTRIYEDIGSQEPQWQEVSATIVQHPVPDGITPVADLLPVEVFADPMLGKVFFALLDNAARHGVSVSTIRVSGQEVPDGYMIRVEDNGTGIADTEKKKIFERGYGKNTGLGLFLVREILAITGITIRETGKAGTGACFEITVPKGAYRFPDRAA